LAAVVSVGLFLILLINPCFDIDIACTFQVFHGDVLNAQDAQAELVVFDGLRCYVPKLATAPVSSLALLEDVDPANDIALRQACAWVV